MRIGITTNRKKHKVPFSCACSYKFHVTVSYIEVYGSFHFVELNLAHDCRVLLFALARWPYNEGIYFGSNVQTLPYDLQGF